jgi:hypothetical protein
MTTDERLAVGEVTEDGYMNRSIVWLEAAANLPDGKHLLYTAAPVMPEVTQEDMAIACDAYMECVGRAAYPRAILAALQAYRARVIGGGND